MRVDNAALPLINGCCRLLARRAARHDEPVVRYLDLGVKVVRLVCHSPRFMRHVERQMTCALRDEADHYDATLIIWQDRNVAEAAFSVKSVLDPQNYRKYRLARLTGQCQPEQMQLFNEDIIRFWPLLDINPADGSLMAWNPETNTYYYAVENLEPEEFIKRGHIFVHTFFRICVGPASSFAHGAVIGLENTGVLFCAFGYRGKSTLCVRALMDGFEYVSDDYFVLGKKEGDALRAWPVYSIVALSPAAYDAMYDKFNGKFLSNNGRKDKYMFNIAAYHDQFRYGYPVKLAMFPNICDCDGPSIVEGGKELALEELCFSTLNQTGNLKDAPTIARLYGFAENLPFYRFNLSRNLDANARCLRDFLENWKQ